MCSCKVRSGGGENLGTCFVGFSSGDELTVPTEYTWDTSWMMKNTQFEEKALSSWPNRRDTIPNLAERKTLLSCQCKFMNGWIAWNGNTSTFISPYSYDRSRTQFRVSFNLVVDSVAGKSTVKMSCNNRTLDNQLKTRRKVAKMLIVVVGMFSLNMFPVHVLPIVSVSWTSSSFWKCS